MQTVMHQGNQYFITFIDNYSHKAYVYFIKTKDQAFSIFQEYKVEIENSTGHHIQALQSDNGGEYTSKTFKTYLRNNGINHQQTAPYIPQQNSIAERYNRTIIKMARTMVHHMGLPLSFWAEAINTVVYICN